jgi:hypothetical protein
MKQPALIRFCILKGLKARASHIGLESVHAQKRSLDRE